MLRPPNTFRYILPVLLFICIGISFYFLRWFGYLVGIPIAIFLNMLIHSVLGVRYWNNCRTIYESLITQHHTENEALLEISRNAHPELSLDTHTAIIDKFNNLDLLINFMSGALPPGNNTDEFALEVLNNTTIQHLRGNRYKVVTKWNKRT